MSKKIEKEVRAVVGFFKKYPPANRGTVMNIANRVDELMHDGKLTGEQAFQLQTEIHDLWPDS